MSLSGLKRGFQMQLNFHVLDVFTEMRGSGNPLAVVLNAGHLSTAQMQALAKEFNLSETAFVTETYGKSHRLTLRIFTPTTELDFAGHPTVGTAVLFGLTEGLNGLRIEENIGTFTCLVENISKTVGRAQFGLAQLPVEKGLAPDREVIAGALGIDAADIGFEMYEPCRFSAGNEFTLVPVRDAGVMPRLKPERRGWLDIFSATSPGVYVFTRGKDHKADLVTRMFSPNMPGGEDAATGSAAAALIGLLASKETESDCHRVLKLQQGREMGRPSEIEMIYTVKDGKLVQAGIGGKAVLFQSGVLHVD